MIPEPIQNQLVGILAEHLTTEEIDKLGRRLENRFNAHLLSGEPFGLTLRKETAARTAVSHFHAKGMLDRLIVLLLHTDTDPSIVGRNVPIPDLAPLLQRLGSIGLKYDPNQGALIRIAHDEEKDLWGYLKEGEPYHFSFLSIDIAENSRLQNTYPKPDIEIVYTNLFQMISQTVKSFKGKVWTWAGDGGLAAFYLDDKVNDSVRCAIHILLNLINLNLSSQKNKLQEPIVLRIGAHDGLTHYKENKGTILSEAINYVAHLEKKGTQGGHIAISESIYKALLDRQRGIFHSAGEFEGMETYTVNMTFDWLKKF